VKIISFLLILLFGFLFLYAAGSFYFISFDIAQWSEAGRFLIVMVTPVVFYAAFTPFMI